LVVVGREEIVAGELRRYEAAGATDLILGDLSDSADRQRSREFLRSYVAG
jgi:hypothetical protein